jgi:hypothetical protein
MVPGLVPGTYPSVLGLCNPANIPTDANAGTAGSERFRRDSAAVPHSPIAAALIGAATEAPDPAN